MKSLNVLQHVSGLSDDLPVALIRHARKKELKPTRRAA